MRRVAPGASQNMKCLSPKRESSQEPASIKSMEDCSPDVDTELTAPTHHSLRVLTAREAPLPLRARLRWGD
ncbi:hypothetical protein GCM10018980_72140 [Streptomyces capoamus]|uniref:Uncharacterized protein n=1 Tax=Streptomyces capoamus TaxID=68183 RepID=A0A919KG06_9ACTN|nr:hypothetical protein GCM10010501_16780 [Streptomyces libani subsp. rufus]GHG74945.1 hypothetical protein GCM10018980_72140 [Streptomyces capoamus]